MTGWLRIINNINSKYEKHIPAINQSKFRILI
jgi:hypothetical protein